MPESSTIAPESAEYATGEITRRRRKACQDEVDERIGYVVDCINAAMHPGEISTLCQEKWGIGSRAIAHYLSRARNRIIAAHDKPVEAHRADAIAVYRAIIDNPDAEHRDVIKAQERIDKLLGLEIHLPKRIEHTGAAGGPIQSVATVVHVDLSAKLAEYQSSIRSAAIANASERQQPGADDIVIPATGQ